MKEIQRRIAQSLTACGHFRIPKQPKPIEQEKNTEIVVSQINNVVRALNLTSQAEV